MPRSFHQFSKTYIICSPLWMAACLLIGCGVEKPDAILEAEKNLPDKIDFYYHIKPILSDRCFACHGPDENKMEAGLRFDIEEKAFAKLESGHRAIVPGNLGRSELYHRIT